MSSYGVPSIVAPPIAPSSSSGSSNEQQMRLQILASLFAPGSVNGSYIAHCKTWEDVPGAPAGSSESKKPRYILLAVQSDGRVKIHKSKRNTNGTFSIGKTWSLEDLRGLEVHKPRRGSMAPNVSVTSFTITINNKAYLWETESSRQQDDFLVTLVRSFRQYTSGGGTGPSAPLQLVGFQVGDIPGAPPAYELPSQPGGSAAPTASALAGLASPPIQSGRGPSRPTTATSVISNESSYYGGGGGISASSSYQHGLRQPLPTSSSALQTETLQDRPSTSQSSRGYGGGLPPGVPQTFSALAEQSQQRSGSPAGAAQVPSVKKKASAASLHSNGGTGTAAGLSTSAPRPPLPNPPSNVSPRVPQNATMPAQPSMRATTPTRQLANQQSTASSSPSHRRKSSAAAVPGLPPNASTAAAAATAKTSDSLDETTAAAKAAALLGQQASGTLDDSDVMLTNVEEMLEGLEWGQSARGGGADQIEKRLLGELDALEAAGIHAIIESDDRVIDVVKYLDSALAELDKMDQMMTLYKTHLHAVSDDISHIESQNKGLQIQSSNQRALLAELDRVLGR